MAERTPQQARPFFEVQQEVRRLFQEMIHQPWGGRELSEASQWQPCCDIAETEKEIIVEIELPGVERKDVHVEVKDSVLRITGERRATIERRTVSISGWSGAMDGSSDTYVCRPASIRKVFAPSFVPAF